MVGTSADITAELKLRLMEKNFKTNVFKYTKLWLRYVDDVFAIIDKDTDSIFLFSLLNKQDPNILFTYEFETDSKLNFLNVSIVNRSGSIETTIYPKPFASNEIINSKWNIPYPYKIAAIRSYINRALIACSDEEVLKDEIEKIIEICKKVGYNRQRYNREINI